MLQEVKECREIDRANHYLTVLVEHIARYAGSDFTRARFHEGLAVFFRVCASVQSGLNVVFVHDAACQ